MPTLGCARQPTFGVTSPAGLLALSSSFRDRPASKTDLFRSTRSATGGSPRRSLFLSKSDTMRRPHPPSSPKFGTMRRHTLLFPPKSDTMRPHPPLFPPKFDTMRRHTLLFPPNFGSMRGHTHLFPPEFGTMRRHTPRFREFQAMTSGYASAVFRIVGDAPTTIDHEVYTDLYRNPLRRAPRTPLRREARHLPRRPGLQG